MHPHANCHIESIGSSNDQWPYENNILLETEIEYHYEAWE